MTRFQIDILNVSTVIEDSQLEPMVAACQRQIHEDFAPEYNLDADLHFIPRGGKADEAHIQGVVGDTSDQLGALAYHDLTIAGLPLFKVFAKTDLDAGYSVSVSLGHELTELLADPEINLLVQDALKNIFYAYEVADPVESDDCGYSINGVLMSDFVFPSYFQTSTQQPQAPFDKTGMLTGIVPAMAPGGYVAFFDPNTGWNQMTNRTDPRSRYRARPREGSRRARRMIPPGQRLRSLR